MITVLNMIFMEEYLMKAQELYIIISLIAFLFSIVLLIIGIKKKMGSYKIISLMTAIVSTLFPLITTTSNYGFDIEPNVSNISSDTMISFESEIPFCKIYYTTDGSSTQKNGIKYIMPFSIDEENVLTGELTVRYTAKIGLFWMETKSKEYNVICDVSSQDDGTAIDNKKEEISVDNDSMEEFSIDNNKDKCVIIEANNKVLISKGSEIVLRTSSGYYLSRNADGNYYANKNEIDSSCIMKIDITNDGYTGFYNISSGTYASAAIDKNPVVLCSVNKYMKSWECFSLYQDNEYIIISSQGKEKNNDEYKYITSDEDDVNRPVYVRAKDAKAWEDFSIFIYSPDDNIWKNPFTSETILDNGYH